MSRRDFLQEVAAASALGAGSGWLLNVLHESNKERQGGVELGEAFEKEVSGYVAFVTLKHNQVLFVDEDNVPIGGPIDYEDIIGEKVNDKGELVSYRYTPGVPNEYGVYVEPPALEWREQIIARLEADPANAGRKVSGSYNVALIFKETLAFADEPELVANIKNGTIKTYGDIVRALAEKDIRNKDLSVYQEGGQPMTRLAYIEKYLSIPNVPPIVQSTLTALVPGLCAQESMFHNGLVSSEGAKGIFQFMPKTWGEYVKNDEKTILSLKHQVEVAGTLLGDMYTRLFSHANTEAMARARQRFPDTDTFMRDFIVPTLINSYNVGPARMAAAINLFFTLDRTIAPGQGLNLFLEMADFTERYDKEHVITEESTDDEKLMRKYDKDAREYVPRVYAHALVLQQKTLNK